ncbi:MAG: DNA polymerase ligase N-terminal domain-containing protein [Nitrospirota bacterium]
MSLSQYRTKRNFEATSEPAGKTILPRKRLRFVVQRHKASRLHYDFRLEVKGILKSWAVPKGPSMNPLDKRLAMMVEDHPYEYRTFKGIIPKGNYGAGIVEIWDQGLYTPLGPDHRPVDDSALLQQLYRGTITFALRGRKLRGEFALVKIKTSEDNAWLLIKKTDAFAVTTAYDSEALTPSSSPINKALKARRSIKNRGAITGIM